MQDLQKEIRREPVSKWFNWKSSAVIAGYASSEIRFSFAKAVYVYPQDDGWTAEVEFQRGKNAPSSEHPTVCRLKPGLKPSG
jgi:hypothetical protein